MSKATGRVTGKYGYNYTCPRCGFVIKFADAKQDWRGVWVCAKDWEPRHPMDFYRQKSDVHVLPITRPDNNALTFAGAAAGYTENISGSVSWTYTYKDDLLNNIRTFRVVGTPSLPTLSIRRDSNNPFTLTLPATLVTAGTYRRSDSFGQFIDSGAIISTSLSINTLFLTIPGSCLIISGQYGI